MKSLLIAAVSCGLLFGGDFYKGQTYYRHLVYPHLGYDGAVFAKKYTKSEWEKLFLDGGRLFFEEFGLKRDLLEGEALTHLFAFVSKFAKDSDETPICEQ